MINKVKWWKLERKSTEKKLIAAKKYREKIKDNPETKEYFRLYREKHKDERREKYTIMRYEVLKLYSGDREPFCACCNEKEVKFLALHHINGGGTQERKNYRTRGGNSFLFYLKKLGFPEGYQVLCHNCNMAKGLYGKCPHKN